MAALVGIDIAALGSEVGRKNVDTEIAIEGVVEIHDG